MIPLSVPRLAGNEWSYVKECLDTGWVSSAGRFVERFETELAAHTGAAHAVACVNGTAALHLALQVLGVGADDDVLVPALTFIAPVNAVRYVGANPVFLDCDEFYNLDAAKTVAFLEQEVVMEGDRAVHKATGRRVAAVIPVHVFGNACDLAPIKEACDARNIRMIEDATESLGTVYRRGPLAGRHTGTIGDIGCFSFNGNKIITTGGGGMLVTDRAAWAEKARYLSTQAKDDPIRYVHNEVGYNMRLTNVQAAMGVAQLEQLPDFVATKRAHYAAYTRALADIDGLTLAPVPAWADNNCWLCAVRVDAARYGRTRDALMDHLRANGVESRPLWAPNHLQVPYRDFPVWRVERAVTEWERTLNIPSSTGLTRDELDTVTRLLKP